MRLLTLLVLLGLSVQASTRISTFNGQTYKAEDLNQCLTDFDYITKTIDGLNGFRILEGGCQSYAGDFYQLKMKYMHPFTKNIETFKTKYESKAICLNQIDSANTAIINSGNTSIMSFCKRAELNVAFIDDTFSVIRSVKNLGRYKTEAQCIGFLKDLDLRAQSFKMTSLASKCKATQYGFSGQTYYIPTFNYISRFDNQVELMNGMESADTNTCNSTQTDIQTNFAQNNVAIVMAFCAQTTSNGQSVKSRILYVKPEAPRYIEDYKALTVTTQNKCQSNLNNIKDGLVAIGYGILNSYCQKLDENKFKPMITYIRTLEI